MSVFLDIDSEKVCSIFCQWLSENVSISWCLKMCVILFGSNSLKVPVMFDMNSENVFTIVWTVLVWVLSIVWTDLWKVFNLN